MVPSAVLFDLGGVVLEIDTGRSMAAWSASSRLPLEAMRQAFQPDAPYRGHETGQVGDDGFLAHLQQRLQLDCDLPGVLAGWNAMLVREIPEALALVDGLRDAGVACHALSNTNPAHAAHIARSFPGFFAHFDRVFLSHEIGHRKPAREAFDHVLAAVGLAPEAVLFLDDAEANVQGARAAGLQAECVRSPVQTRQALARHGLLARGDAAGIAERA